MKKIAVIHDLSGLGKCSLTAAIPVISAMGVQACPLPTAILSNQTGYGSYFWDDYTDRMELIMDEWKKTGFTRFCVLSHNRQVYLSDLPLPEALRKTIIVHPGEGHF